MDNKSSKESGSDLITRIEQALASAQKELGTRQYPTIAQMGELLQEAANVIKGLSQKVTDLQVERDLMKEDLKGLWEAYEDKGAWIDP